MKDNSSRRDAERTRRAVLDSAQKLMGAGGINVPLATIAAAAGISKSGLLHHFPTREALLVAIVQDSLVSFRDSIFNYIDLSENSPGKLLRAYVRALCGGDESAMQYFTFSPLWHGIESLPDASKLLDEDSHWWQENLAADGLEPRRIAIVRRAAEGMAAAYGIGEETMEDLVATGEDLIKMTLD